MKYTSSSIPPNPFDRKKDPKEIMNDLLQASKPLTHSEAIKRMKEARKAQRKNK